MHVLAEDQLLAGDEAQRGDQVAVARAGHDALVLPHRERMGSGRPDREPVLVGRRLDAPAQLAKLLAGLARVARRRGRDLEHGLHQLGLDVALGLRHRFEHGLDAIRELERLGIDDHELLFDTQRVAGARESVLHARHGTSRWGYPPPRWRSATTESSSSWHSTNAGRSRTSCSRSKAIRTRSRRARSAT